MISLDYFASPKCLTLRPLPTDGEPALNIPNAPNAILLSRQDLKSLGIRVSNSSLLRWEALGRFPKRVRLAGTTVCWLSQEVHDWLAARAAERSRHIYAEL